MKKNIFLVTFLLSFCSLNINAQPWMDNLKSSNPTLGEIKASFNEYWKDKTVEKGHGHKTFKRWEWYWSQRIKDTDTIPRTSIIWEEWSKYLASHNTSQARRTSDANWTFQGPSTSNGGYAGIGRISCIAFHPTDINTFWLGTGAGGLWKTSDGGQSWATNYDIMPVLGVSDIAIDPVNPAIMYLATGDADAGDTQSIGILKSKNGGNTWLTTGLSFNVSQRRQIQRVIVNPLNTLTVIAAASNGIYRSTDGGQNWTTHIAGSNFKDIEFKPNDPSVVYAATYSGRIYMSTNGGQTWSIATTITGGGRIALAVSPSAPDVVMAVCADPNGGLFGIYKSTNSGGSFTKVFTGTSTTNLLASSYSGSGTGGQGWYDLAFAVNPTNVNDVWLGGVNNWNSKDGGVTWTNKTMWAGGSGTNPNGKPVVHADKHAAAYHPLNPAMIFDCNDGGVYVGTNDGNTWTDLSNGLGISQIYRLGTSATVNNNVICGLQDNGTKQWSNNSWKDRTGGDGMECIIDYNNANIMYSTYVQGLIYKTTNGGGYWNTIVTYSGTGVNEPGDWVTPYIMHPTTSSTILVGKSQVYRTLNAGSSWTQLGTLPLGGSNVNAMAYAPSDPNTIYISTYNLLYKSTNGGTTWSSIYSSQNEISYITVSENDPLKFWITISGFSNGNKVIETTDGGVTFNNISGTLPNVPANCITYEKGSNGALYIGTDVGVFYRNASMTDWEYYNTGLPNVVVTELEIAYGNRKLWASTYGRGLWNSDLYTVLPLNLLEFTATPLNKVVSLKWSTSAEVNTKEFQIEKSVDGFAWSQLGRVSSKNSPGTHNYNFTDQEPVKGVNYYRLKMVDIDGKFTHSPIRTANMFGSNNQSIAIAPNPTKNFTTIYFNRQIESAEIAVMNAEGKQIFKDKVRGATTTHKLNTSTLAPGLYIVNVKTNIGGSFSERLIVTN